MHDHKQGDFKKAIVARKKTSELPKTVEITLGDDKNDQEFMTEQKSNIA